MARTWSPAATIAHASTTPGRGWKLRQLRMCGVVLRARSGVVGASRTSWSYALPTVWPSIEWTGRMPLRTASSSSAKRSCGWSQGPRCCGTTRPGLRESRLAGGRVEATVRAAALSYALLVPVSLTQIAPRSAGPAASALPGGNLCW